MLKKHTEKRGAPATTTRGRPKNPAITSLVESLIGRQDAMSRRTAARINAILDSHVSRDAAAFVWAQHTAAVRVRLARFVDDAVARLAPTQPEPLRGVLAELVAEALAALRPDAFGPVPNAAPLEEEPRPVVRRSGSLAAARGQHADLQTKLLNLHMRIRS
jgi:hypothetical protein